MAGEWKTERISAVANVTDFVANGSFESLRNNVTYRNEPDYAVLVRLVDHNSGWKGDFVYVDKASFDFLKKSVVRPGDIIIANVGANAGTVFRVPALQKPMTLGPNAILCRPFEEILDRDFLYYYLTGQDGQDSIASILGGSAQPKFNKTDFRSLQVPVPPLPKQKAIAHILGTLDDKIELNRRMNATLEAMARALFQSWFVDFDPVRAKLDGRQPAGLDEATAALFPTHFQDSDDGKIPVGWQRAPISELCSINSWTLGKSDDLETLEYVEISEVSRGNIANLASYQRGEEPSRARRRLRHGDTVLSTVRPDRGAYFLALNPPENRVASTGFAVLTPTKAPWAFIHAAMTQPDVSDHLGQMADGGAYPAVRPEIIGAWEAFLPDQDGILDAFQRTCAPLFEQAEANRIQSRTLAALRDTLLPKLLSGDLPVADINDLAHSSSGTDA